MKTTMTNGLLGQLALLVIVIATLVACSTACFIRNCPVGGKRALEEMTNIPAQRTCLRCGPSGLGQCVGPNICCGADIGCYINTAESATCGRENDVSEPCEVEGERCGPDEDGHCVADSVCCSEDQCHLTSECRSLPSSMNHVSPLTLQYIRRILLQQKAYVDRR